MQAGPIFILQESPWMALLLFKLLQLTGSGHPLLNGAHNRCFI